MEQDKMMDKNQEWVNEKGQTEKEFLDWYQREEKDKYEKPSVTTDMLLFTVDDKVEKNTRKLPKKELKVLLIKRKDHPYIGKWALPGGFLNMDEDLDKTAERELKEETNLDDIYMEQLYTWGDVDRDPRMRVISTSYMALIDNKNLQLKAGDDALEAKWFVLTREELDEEIVKENGVLFHTKYMNLHLTSDDGNDQIIFKLSMETSIHRKRSTTQVKVVPSASNTNNVAFDHINILNYGLDRLQKKLEYTSIVFNLMPETFTLTELQMVYETILGRNLLKANFRRKIMPMVSETDKVRGDSAHRPSKLFTFNEEWWTQTKFM